MADQSWFQSIGFENLLRAFGPIGTAAAAVWGVWKFGAERSDRRDDRHETRQERVQRELDEQQARMSKQGADALTWMREEADRMQQRVLRVEVERDEAYHSSDAAWDIARGWKERAHQLKHDLDNARTAVNAVQIQLGRNPRPWPDERLPPLDQIVEDNARKLSERRSIYDPRIAPPQEPGADDV